MDLFNDAKPELDQWFTPAWAAEAIIDQEFGWLRPGDRVIEPSCGDGAFLCALPPGVEALGIEIDPVMAQRARENSGRDVITGNFLSLPMEQLGQAAAIVGNPPFQSDVVARFVDRSAELLVEGGVAGLILPAYIFQASSKVEMLSEKFSIRQSMLPRNLFPRLKLPLVFATFTKEKHRKLFGFLLYREAQEINAVAKCWKPLLVSGRGTRGAWYPVVHEILTALGGEATLESVYNAVQLRRPTENCHWKEKVRQVLQHPKRFRRTAPGRYALASAMQEAVGA